MNLQNANAALFAAMALAQGEIENAAKASVNPHFKSKYADLAEVLNTVRPVFAKNGLAIIQSSACDGQVVTVTTAVAHKDGGYITSELSCVPAKFDAQGLGSVTTYLRRYQLAAMAGCAQEDLDGNDSMHNKPGASAQQRPSGKLAGIMSRIAAAETLDELTAIREDIKPLVGAERSHAIEAGMARQAIIQSAAAKGVE